MSTTASDGPCCISLSTPGYGVVGGGLASGADQSSVEGDLPDELGCLETVLVEGPLEKTSLVPV